ncbi:MAG: head-tail connector protein [Bacteroidota bacterium]
MTSYRVTSGPSDEPFQLQEVKDHLKVDFSTDDTLINALIVSARQNVENYTNLALMPQTVTQKFDSFYEDTWNGLLELSVSPLIGIDSFQYKNSDGQSATFESADYIQHSFQSPPRISLAEGKSWPTTANEDQAITVVYQAGFASADAVPKLIKQAMLLMIGHWYENRQDSVERLPKASERLLWNYRVIS